MIHTRGYRLNDGIWIWNFIMDMEFVKVKLCGYKNYLYQSLPLYQSDIKKHWAIQKRIYSSFSHTLKYRQVWLPRIEEKKNTDEIKVFLVTQKSNLSLP